MQIWSLVTRFLHYSLTYQVGVPLPITGVKFGMGIEYGYDCLKPGDFTNEVSLKTCVIRRERKINWC